MDGSRPDSREQGAPGGVRLGCLPHSPLEKSLCGWVLKENRLILLKGGSSPPQPCFMYSNINLKEKKNASDSKSQELSLRCSLRVCHRRAKVQEHVR